MTITAWILFALIAFGIAFGVFIVGEAGDWSTAVTVIIAVVLIAAVLAACGGIIIIQLAAAGL